MDNQPLIIAQLLVAVVTSGVVLLNSASNKHIPGLSLIAAGFLITNAGVVMLATQGELNVLFSVIGVNALILGGRILIVSGLTGFWNQERSRLPMITAGLFILTMAGIAFFTYVQDSEPWRIRLYAAMMVIFSFCNMYIVMAGLGIEKKLRPVMTVSSNYGAFLVIMLFGFNAVTETILMFVRAGTSAGTAEAAFSLLLLGSIFTMIMFAFAINIMTMEELTMEHKENAIYDPITTIFNHRSFVEVAQRVCGVALRYETPVSMLSIEVENMDQVMKQHGHKVANELLRHFSLMATDRRRHEDVLARSGFKEFRMLLPGVDEEGARVVIDKIRQTIRGEEFIYRGKKVEPRLNIAAITRRNEGLNLSQMLQDGEVALYRVKQQAGGA